MTAKQIREYAVRKNACNVALEWFDRYVVRVAKSGAKFNADQMWRALVKYDHYAAAWFHRRALPEVNCYGRDYECAKSFLHAFPDFPVPVAYRRKRKTATKRVKG